MRRPKIDRSWPAWRFNPITGDGEVFQCEEDVPEGWTGAPVELEIFEHTTFEPLDQEAILAALIDKGVDIDPTWGVAHMKKVLDS